jgi:predicted HD phosphohydrolase
MRRVGFIRMKDGTARDYRIIGENFAAAELPLADEVLEQLKKPDHVDIGLPIDRLQHALQSATRAYRAGEDEEMVVACLLHDVGDNLAPWNHPELAAAILRPYVSERVHWVVLHHGLFQTHYYNHHFGRDPDARDIHRASIRITIRCRWKPSSRWCAGCLPKPRIATLRPTIRAADV